MGSHWVRGTFTVQGKASKRVLKNQGAREIIDIKTAVRHLFLWNPRWEGLFVSSSCLLAWTRLCARHPATMQVSSDERGGVCHYRRDANSQNKSLLVTRLKQRNTPEKQRLQRPRRYGLAMRHLNTQSAPHVAKHTLQTNNTPTQRNAPRGAMATSRRCTSAAGARGGVVCPARLNHCAQRLQLRRPRRGEGQSLLL